MHQAALHDIRAAERTVDFAALFPPAEHGAEITARTAALLHDVLCYLGEVGRVRVELCGDRAVRDADEDLFTALPAFTWSEGRRWRGRFVAAFDTLAARIDRGEAPLPHTPAEEFAGWLAIVQSILLIDLQPDLVRRTVAEIPPDRADFDWARCRARLLRHACLPLFYRAEFTGLEDPGNAANLSLGLGDYRPASWFRSFGGPVPAPACR